MTVLTDLFKKMTDTFKKDKIRQNQVYLRTNVIVFLTEKTVRVGKHENSEEVGTI